MGLMDKFLNSMKLSDIEDEDFDDDYYDEGEIIDNTVRKPAPIMDDKEYNEPIDFKSKKNAASQKITPMRSAKKYLLQEWRYVLLNQPALMNQERLQTHY